MASAGALEARASVCAGTDREDDLEQLSKPRPTRTPGAPADAAGRRNARVLSFVYDYDRLIDACSRKLRENGRNVRALLIRASSYHKKGADSGEGRPQGRRRRGAARTCCRGRGRGNRCAPRPPSRLWAASSAWRGTPAGAPQPPPCGGSHPRGRQRTPSPAVWTRPCRTRDAPAPPTPADPPAPRVGAGCLEEALADYHAVLRLEPRSVDALYHRGAVHEKLGHLDDAIKDFTGARLAHVHATKMVIGRYRPSA